ncbi:MAG: hypothetical protein ACI9BW_002988 [Gammaproteobacteria bacterium]|jgi:hypothetical protein
MKLNEIDETMTIVLTGNDLSSPQNPDKTWGAIEHNELLEVDVLQPCSARKTRIT